MIGLPQTPDLVMTGHMFADMYWQPTKPPCLIGPTQIDLLCPSTYLDSSACNYGGLPRKY